MLWTTNTTYQLQKKALDTSALRQEVHSHNLANVNTRNYEAKSVNFESLLTNEGSLTLQTAHQRHLGQTQQLPTPQVVTQTSGMMNQNGNNVDVDVEMANLAANQITYDLLIQQTDKKLQGYRKVIQA